MICILTWRLRNLRGFANVEIMPATKAPPRIFSAKTKVPLNDKFTFAPVNTWLSSRPLKNFDTVYALLRIVTGFFVLYHGWEVFDPSLMADYAKWLTDLQFPAPLWMVYLGKSAEFAGGACLMAGLATRFAAIPVILVMLSVAFGMGHGKVWYGDQHPFMFVLLGVLFLSGGAGKWSVDAIWTNRYAA